MLNLLTSVYAKPSAVFLILTVLQSAVLSGQSQGRTELAWETIEAFPTGSWLKITSTAGTITSGKLVVSSAESPLPHHSTRQGSSGSRLWQAIPATRSSGVPSSERTA